MKNNQVKGAHGGARPGAGRKANTPNKASIERQAKVAASGQTPLDYMLSVMRDELADDKRRDDMAKAAAPYVHPRLSNIDATVTGEVGLKVEIVRFGRSASE